MITEGIVAFSDLQETEKFNGQDTGKYSIVLTLEAEEAEAVESEGVHLREYQNQKQRKFVTKYPDFQVLDVEGEPTSKQIPYGSKVKVMWTPGKAHPTHGVAPYFKKIKVLELAIHDTDDVDDEDF
jgi:hypothetical protein|tara:strand:- start:58 stop:435 length:378 start_codon:yes stop_codon:yes gene_type:complete